MVCTNAYRQQVMGLHFQIETAPIFYLTSKVGYHTVACDVGSVVDVQKGRHFVRLVIQLPIVNWPIIVLLGVFLHLTSICWALNPDMNAEWTRTYKNAYEAVTHGSAYDGTVQLIEMLRAVPGDDVAHSDSLIGPAQLLGFSVASLLDWPQRTSLLSDVLEPNTYETDELLIASMQAGSGVQSMALPARFKLKKLSESNHLAVKVAALYILGEPYYYSGTYTQDPAVAELVLSYPNLEFTRCIIEMPVYNALGDAINDGASEKYLLGDVVYWGGRREPVLQASAGLARAAEALPTMNIQDLDDDVVTQWAISLSNDPLPQSRYTIVAMLAKSCNTPERRAAARLGLDVLAKQKANTPDVVRARTLLADFARKDHQPESLLRIVLDLLTLDVLPSTAERSMYESVMQTSQHASKYFTLYGYHQEATQIHEALAAKFPETTLSTTELRANDALQADALQATMTLINQAVSTPLRNGDVSKVSLLYEEIMAHTQHGALKTALQKRLETIRRDSDKIREQMKADYESSLDQEEY